MLSRLYGGLALRRRRWHARRPERRRRLDRPVVSVGALAAGGSGKTPVAAHVAALLASMGERPAVLSRGYARTRRADGVVVVSDGRGVRADLAAAGDEPLMLARALPEAAVLVCEDRHLAGRLAETRMGVTAHVLDDGFQQLALHRDVDLLVLGASDLTDPRTLPGGRLREPIEAAARADAAIVETPDAGAAQDAGAADAAARSAAARLGVDRAFRFARTLRPPRAAETGRDVAIQSSASVLAVAGVARPEAFFAALRRGGYAVADTLAFRDHHPYSARDVAEIGRRAAASRARRVVTTEKDLMRLLPHAPFGFSLLSMPLAVTIEPAAAFRTWLEARLRQAREPAG